MNSGTQYDVAIIGAGLSGLAAGIRLAHFGKRVCIFERHNAAGGLNGFYSLGGRKYDVGLHAVTNYVPAGIKGTPLGKILRQLRIDRDEFALCPQKGSRVSFGPHGEATLRFTNDFGVLESEVAARFPAAADGFREIARFVRETPLSGEGDRASARAFIRERIRDPLLEDMLLCPLMFYGSAREDDMDLGQFAIMFRALYLEGFARPLEGVRVLMRVLLEKYREAGGERRMKCGVSRIVSREGRAASLILDSGEEIVAAQVLSSIGIAETEALMGAPRAAERTLGYVETISVLDRAPAAMGWGRRHDCLLQTTPSGSPTETPRPRSTRGAESSASRTTSSMAGAAIFPRDYSASPALRTTTPGLHCPGRRTKPPSFAGSVPCRNRRSASFRRSFPPGFARAGDRGHRHVHTPTTVVRYNRTLPRRYLRGAYQEPQRAHGPLEPLPVRDRPGDARDRGFHAERDFDGQPAHTQGLGKASCAPETSCRGHRPSLTIAPPWHMTGSRESPTSMT